MESLSARGRRTLEIFLVVLIGVLASGRNLRAQEQSSPEPQNSVQEKGVQEQIRALEDRIRDLEDTTDTLEEAVGGDRAIPRAYSAKALNFGGHVSAQYWGYSGKDGSTAGFYAVFTEFYIKAELGEDWSLFATPGIYAISDVRLQNIRNPEIALHEEPFNVVMARAYFEWSHVDALRIRAGIQSTELGVISRSGFIPDRILGTTPLMSRIYTLTSLYPQIVNGLSVGGKLRAGTQDSDWWEYSAYFGSEIMNPSEPALGARLGYVFGKMGLAVNVSYAHGVRQDASAVVGAPVPPAANLSYSISPVPVYSNDTEAFDLVGFDLEYSMDSLGLKAEVYKSSEDSTIMKDKTGFFIQPTWWVGESVALTYRFDYYDSGHGFGPARENILGVTWDPVESVRLRAAYYHTDVRGEFLNSVSLSFSVSF